MAHVESTLFVIIGATGDLTRRKLLPATAGIVADNGWQEKIWILGVGREDMEDQQFRKIARQSLDEAGLEDEEMSAWCDESVFYQSVSEESGGYDALAARISDLEGELGLPGNRILYLAIPPQAFGPVIDSLGDAGLGESPGFTRLVVEKPFGHDLPSAEELNRHVHRKFDEDQVYRIDHYLGKETVQNLLVFRFSNALFETAWNRDRVQSVEITVAEDLGLEGRAGYYDKNGAMRDMVQNHVTQLLTLVAMEPPVKLEANAIRDEKVKVLRSIKPIRPEDVHFGQYDDGEVDGEEVTAYRHEPDVEDDTLTETAVAMRVEIDNWRWQGVPFYIRTGKRFAERLTQIVVRFEEPPVCLFEVDHACEVHTDAIVIILQPNEGFQLWFDVKAPEDVLRLQPLPLEFRYADAFGEIPKAYETLIMDVLIGDQTLFVRGDEVEYAWKLYQPVLDNPPKPALYPAGSWGPHSFSGLVGQKGHAWWNEEIGGR